MSNGMYYSTTVFGQTSGYVGVWGAVLCNAVRAATVCMYLVVGMSEPQVRRGGSGSLCIRPGPKQSCADRDGQERPPTRKERPGRRTPHHTWPRPSLLFILALNRPFRSLPGIARPGSHWARVARSAGHGLPLFHETVLSRWRPPELRPGVLLACLQPSVAITLMGSASASHSCCDHEGPSPLGAAAVPRRPNLHWPKASAPTRGRWQLGLLPHDGAVQGRSLARMAHDCYLDRARKVLLPESPAKRG